MTDEQRHAFENLMLLCPNCHRLVDRLEPDRHPVSLLLDMKAKHEGRAERLSWSESALDRFAELAIAEYLATTASEPAETPSLGTDVDPLPRIETVRDSLGTTATGHGTGTGRFAVAREPVFPGQRITFRCRASAPAATAVSWVFHMPDDSQETCSGKTCEWTWYVQNMVGDGAQLHIDLEADDGPRRGTAHTFDDQVWFTYDIRSTSDAA
jgi:hypothetical protein